MGFAPSSSPARGATAPRRLPPPPLGAAATRGGGMAAWAVGRRAPLLPIFLSPSRRRCRQRERGISVESCFFSPFGIWGSILVRRAAAVRQAELCSQWMGCVTGRCGFNHSVGVRCTRRAPILDLHGALRSFYLCWRRRVYSSPGWRSCGTGSTSSRPAFKTGAAPRPPTARYACGSSEYGESRETPPHIAISPHTKR